MHHSRIDSIIGNWRLFLNQFLQELSELGMDVMPYECDHICYRVATIDHYEKTREALKAFGLLLTEANVNGRPIATFALHQPLRLGLREIPLLELPSPKPNKPYPAGLEHVEFCVGPDLSAFAKKYPHLTFDMSNGDKSINPDIQLNLQCGVVKFHPYSLRQVIAEEKASLHV